MYNEFYEHRRSDTVKWVIAFLLIAILFVGLAANLYMTFHTETETPVEDTVTDKVNGDNETDEQPDEAPENVINPTSTPAIVPGGVTTLEGKELESKQVYAMSKAMTFSSPSAYSRSAPTGVTVEATVYPVSATDKAVDWSVEFVDPTATWAADKTVTDYITVTPESDGSNVATVVCLQPFASPIKITVTSRNNANATAECLVDYRAKVSAITVRNTSITNNVVGGNLMFVNSQFSDTVEAGGSTGGFIIINPLDTTTLAPEYNVVPTEGTVGLTDIINIPTDYHVDMKMTFSPELAQALSNAGYTVTNADGYVFINGGMKNSYGPSVTGAAGFAGKIVALLQECTNYSSLGESAQRELLNFVITYNTSAAFRLQVGYTNSTTQEISEFLDTYCEIILNPAVTHIELNTGNLEF